MLVRLIVFSRDEGPQFSVGEFDSVDAKLDLEILGEVEVLFASTELPPVAEEVFG